LTLTAVEGETKMPIYYLEPRNDDTSDPNWEASSLTEGCWTEADSEELARRKVEQATFEAILPKIGKNKLSSPWTQPELVQCRIDESQKSVPSSQVLSKSGKIIDVPTVPTSP
jgi:hypothetical protein